MLAAKLCTNKILQFLTGGAGLTQVDLYNGRKTVVVVLCIYQLFAGKRGDVHNTVKRTLASSS